MTDPLSPNCLKFSMDCQMSMRVSYMYMYVCMCTAYFVFFK